MNVLDSIFTTFYSLFLSVHVYRSGYLTLPSWMTSFTYALRQLQLTKFPVNQQSSSLSLGHVFIYLDVLILCEAFKLETSLLGYLYLFIYNRVDPIILLRVWTLFFFAESFFLYCFIVCSLRLCHDWQSILGCWVNHLPPLNGDQFNYDRNLYKNYNEQSVYFFLL